MTILMSAMFRGTALITGKLLFQSGYPKVQRLLEGGTYLRLGVYYLIKYILLPQIKYILTFNVKSILDDIFYSL